jgi:predicted DNA-binding protein (MmcQ/YjbR family)
MNHEVIREFALGFAHVTEGFPFDESSLVFKVHGKIFAVLDLNAQPPKITLKNSPERNFELRELYDWILPGYHANKQHWNTVIAVEHASWERIKNMITTSYKLVWQKLPKKVREGSV